MYLQQQHQSSKIKKDENGKIKLSDIDFNLETVINSKWKNQKRRRKYEKSSSEESDEDSSVDESSYELEPVKKKTKKKIKETILYQNKKRKKRVL